MMEAVARGAAGAGGEVIGIVPGISPEEANPHCTHVVASGVGHARNLAVVASGEVTLAVGGEWGTLSEIGLARALGRPVVALRSWASQGQGRWSRHRASSPRRAPRRRSPRRSAVAERRQSSGRGAPSAAPSAGCRPRGGSGRAAAPPARSPSSGRARSPPRCRGRLRARPCARRRAAPREPPRSASGRRRDPATPAGPTCPATAPRPRADGWSPIEPTSSPAVLEHEEEVAVPLDRGAESLLEVLDRGRRPRSPASALRRRRPSSRGRSPRSPRSSPAAPPSRQDRARPLRPPSGVRARARAGRGSRRRGTRRAAWSSGGRRCGRRRARAAGRRAWRRGAGRRSSAPVRGAALARAPPGSRRTRPSAPSRDLAPCQSSDGTMPKRPPSPDEPAAGCGAPAREESGPREGPHRPGRRRVEAGSRLLRLRTEPRPPPRACSEIACSQSPRGGPAIALPR